MNPPNIIANLEVSSPINYRIKIDWRNDTERFFKLEIYKLPAYLNKIPSNNVVDIGTGHLVGFMPQLAVGMGTARLALPAVSTEDKTIILNFTEDFLNEMTKEDLLLLQFKIASTLDHLNQKLSLNPYFLDTI